MRISLLTVALIVSSANHANTVNLSDVELPSPMSKTPVQLKADMQRVKSNRGNALFFEDFQTQADPENPVLPVGWVVIDVDGLTPANPWPDAWIVTEDTNIGEGLLTAGSTSWYNPPGQADDWLITPLISISDNSVLSWVSRSFEDTFRDGYEVYVSTTTQDVAGCSVDDPVFTIAEEEIVYTAREVDLAVAGYSNDDVYICFRNNSVDKNILQIDDITVIEVLAENDVVLDAVAAPPEYTQVPDKLLSYDIPLAVEFSNPTLLEQSNITVEAEILLDGMPLTTISQVYAGPLAAGGSDSFDLGSFTATAVGVYDVVYTLTLDGVVDENPADNTATVNAAIEITTDTMSRDDGEVNTGALGIGAGTDGYLGSQFEFNTEVTVSAVQFIHEDNGGLDGESLRVDVFKLNTATGLPDELVGTSDEYLVPVGALGATTVDLTFQGDLNLSPGEYVFALYEPALESVALHTTENRFTPGKSWVVFPTDPIGTWDNLENIGSGFPVTFYIRPKFVETDLIFKDGFE